MKILSSFTRPHVVSSLNDIRPTSENRRRYFSVSSLWLPLHFFSQTMEVKRNRKRFFLNILKNISFNIPQVTASQSCRFGTTWGRVNEDRIKHFGCTVPLNFLFKLNYTVLIFVKILSHIENLLYFQFQYLTMQKCLSSGSSTHDLLYCWPIHAAIFS